MNIIHSIGLGIIAWVLTYSWFHTRDSEERTFVFASLIAIAVFLITL